MIDEALLLIIEFAGAALGQEVRKTHNRIQWSPQLVTHIGKKFAFQLCGAFDFTIAESEFTISGFQSRCEYPAFLFGA